ncbi:hypothetical protein [Gluconobacter cerinus]|uniref:hypothetical protein n=1 Tax=Gluconobacter cerinus TaxID=38307 RepID=UPI001B8BC9BF|nr:hypothetical protein [Gluconobacter cerinus]MBS1038126.1 hypothetical protein [Gluconobacter cerinus]
MKNINKKKLEKDIANNMKTSDILAKYDVNNTDIFRIRKKLGVKYNPIQHINMEQFLKDCEKGMRLKDLSKKYSLSLYLVSKVKKEKEMDFQSRIKKISEDELSNKTEYSIAKKYNISNGAIKRHKKKINNH